MAARVLGNWSRRAWQNPQRLDIPMVHRMCWYAAALGCDPAESMWPLSTVTIAKRTRHNYATLSGLVVREQALALYRAGAVWLVPCWPNAILYSQRPAKVKFTAEALQHPDVVEIMWSDGINGPWGLST